MVGVVNSNHSPTASDVIFTHTPPLAAASAPDVMVCPLPAGERFSASNTIEDWPNPTERVSRRTLSKTARESRMRSKPSLRLNDIEPLLVAGQDREAGSEAAAAIKGVGRKRGPVVERQRDVR